MTTKNRIKLLIVDDEKDICRFEKSYFLRRDFDVYTAQTGTVAINLAKKVKPQLAIIDIHMIKGISGIEILQRLLEINPDCKCIMVTWDREQAIQAKSMGAEDFVIKPSEIKNVEKSVNRIIKSLKKRQE